MNCLGEFVFDFFIEQSSSNFIYFLVELQKVKLIKKFNKKQQIILIVFIDI